MQASQSVILDIYEQKTFSQMMRGIMICYKEWLVIIIIIFLIFLLIINTTYIYNYITLTNTYK